MNRADHSLSPVALCPVKVKSKWATPTLEAELFNLVNNVPFSGLRQLGKLNKPNELDD